MKRNGIFQWFSAGLQPKRDTVVVLVLQRRLQFRAELGLGPTSLARRARWHQSHHSVLKTNIRLSLNHKPHLNPSDSIQVDPTRQLLGLHLFLFAVVQNCNNSTGFTRLTPLNHSRPQPPRQLPPPPSPCSSRSLTLPPPLLLSPSPLPLQPRAILVCWRMFAHERRPIDKWDNKQ